MTTTIDGRRIAFLVAMEGVEQVELTEPWRAMHEAGATTDLLSTEAGEIQAFNHLDKGDRFPVTSSSRTQTPTTTTRSSCPEALPILMLCEPTATRWSSIFPSSAPRSSKSSPKAATRSPPPTHPDPDRRCACCPQPATDPGPFTRVC